MRPGWYVVMYHDVSWAEDTHLRGLGTTCPPDLFRGHVEALVSRGRIVPADEGRRALASGRLREALFTLTFDDGYRGVVEHALPVLADAGVTAAVAVCSDFLDRRDMFWRCKLCHVRHRGSLDDLRSALAPLGLGEGESVKRFTMDHFSVRVLEAVDAAYGRVVSAEDRVRHLERIFAGADDVRALASAGWEIANHTASHHPVGEATCVSELPGQFGACEEALKGTFGRPSDLWVLPFDREWRRSPDLLEQFRSGSGSRSLVLWGERANDAGSAEAGIVFRVAAPAAPAEELLARLQAASRRRGLPRGMR